MQKLMRGSTSECLEFLQFLYKLLRSSTPFCKTRYLWALEKSRLPGYDPCERRLRSIRGGTDRIPMPYWMHSHFDIYGRPEGEQPRRQSFELPSKD